VTRRIIWITSSPCHWITVSLDHRVAGSLVCWPSHSLGRDGRWVWGSSRGFVGAGGAKLADRFGGGLRSGEETETALVEPATADGPRRSLRAIGCEPLVVGRGVREARQRGGEREAAEEGDGATTPFRRNVALAQPGGSRGESRPAANAGVKSEPGSTAGAVEPGGMNRGEQETAAQCRGRCLGFAVLGSLCGVSRSVP